MKVAVKQRIRKKSAAPLGLADHQRRHLLRSNLSTARIHTAFATGIPAQLEQLDVKG